MTRPAFPFDSPTLCSIRALMLGVLAWSAAGSAIAQNSPTDPPDLNYLGMRIASIRNWTSQEGRGLAELSTGSSPHGEVAFTITSNTGERQKHYLTRQGEQLVAWGGAFEITPDRDCFIIVDKSRTGTQAYTRNGRIVDPRAANRFCPARQNAGETFPNEIAGRWTTTLGVLELQREGDGVVGLLSRPDSGGAARPYRRIAVDFRHEGSPGAWAPIDAELGGRLTFVMARDRRSFTGDIWTADGRRQSWSGQRDAPPTSSGRPAPSSQPSASAPSPAPAPQSPAPTSAPSAQGFLVLGKFDVRFDRLERPRGETLVRAVVTIRNATDQAQHLPSGVFRAILTDADGAGQERNQLWRGSGEPATTFNGTPTLQPGASLTVRFVFNPDIRRLQSLTLISGAEQAVFALNGA